MFWIWSEIFGSEELNKRIYKENKGSSYNGGKEMTRLITCTFCGALGGHKDDCPFNNTDGDVNHPSHYNKGEIEVHDFIEDQKLEWSESCVIKYICRARWKGDEVKDLKKARWYI